MGENYLKAPLTHDSALGEAFLYPNFSVTLKGSLNTCFGGAVAKPDNITYDIR